MRARRKQEAGVGTRHWWRSGVAETGAGESLADRLGLFRQQATIYRCSSLMATPPPPPRSKNLVIVNEEEEEEQTA